jgi:poly-gamma-glutamate synthesis protein (capsule biosynthesis protein)
MDRKAFLSMGGRTLAAAAFARPLLGSHAMIDDERHVSGPPTSRDLTLLLAGDVMTGRGIDQILPRSVPPTLHEPYARSAEEYVRLAERKSGPIPAPVKTDYVWGDALTITQDIAPDLRIVNLETSITTCAEFWPGKQIHYRMHPANVDVLLEMGIDAVSLGNNHVMDFGHTGLKETLDVLARSGIATCGVGRTEVSAAAPAVLKTASGRVLVFSYGLPSAGIPKIWAAHGDRPGINLLDDLQAGSIKRVIEEVGRVREDGDRVIVSLHWGPNWGYAIPPSHRTFAHNLIDSEAVDVIFGHSSHHPVGIEVYRGRLILYGCGDLVNDYEGISGHEEYRSDLRLIYLPRLAESGRLVGMHMIPLQTRRFRLVSASDEDVEWLSATLDRVSARLGARVSIGAHSRLELEMA